MAYYNHKKVLAVVKIASITEQLQAKEVEPSTSDIIVTADSGYAGLSQVKVKGGFVVDPHKAYDTESDTTLAVLKNVPAVSLPIASLDGLKGNSEVASNLFVSPSIAPTTRSGVAYSADNQTLTLNGTSTAGEYINVGSQTLPAGTYSLKAFKDSDHATNCYFGLYKEGVTPSLAIANGTFTLSEETTLSIVIWWGMSGISFSNTEVKFSIVKGSSVPTEWEANFAGIKDSEPTKLISHGFNLWDEVAEIGNIDATTGQNDSSPSVIRSKNYIPVFSNAIYYKSWGNYNGRIFFYDFNKNYLGYINDAVSGTFTIPANCAFIRFRMASGYGTTYNHDICINVSNASLNGTYKAHREDIEYPLNENEDVMRSAGSVKDTDEKENVGAVDLGTLTYIYQNGSGENRFIALLPTLESANARTIFLLAPNYDCKSNGESFNPNWDMVIYNGQHEGATAVFLHNHGYTDPTAFKTAMSGVMMNYPLATPIDREISKPDTIQVEEGGTLEIVCEGAVAEFDMTYLVEE